MKLDNQKSFPTVSSNKEQKKKIHDYALVLYEYCKEKGVLARVMEVNFRPYGIEFFVEIAHGTPIGSLLKLETGIAKALSAPGKMVSIIAPVRGCNFAKIILPWVHPYSKIPIPIIPESGFPGIKLLKKSIQYYEWYQKFFGTNGNNQTHHYWNDSSDCAKNYQLIKNEFSQFERKPNLPQYAKMVEDTINTFGIPCTIFEVINRPDDILFNIKPKEKIEYEQILQYHRDLAMLFNMSIGQIRIVNALDEYGVFGICIDRRNYLGDTYTRQNNAVAENTSRKGIRKIVGDWLLRKSWKYFFRYDEIFLDEGLSWLWAIYRNKYKKLCTEELIDLLNTQTLDTLSTREHTSANAAIQSILEDRNIDLSAIVAPGGGLLENTNCHLDGKKIVR